MTEFFYTLAECERNIAVYGRLIARREQQWENMQYAGDHEAARKENLSIDFLKNQRARWYPRLATIRNNTMRHYVRITTHPRLTDNQCLELQVTSSNPHLLSAIAHRLRRNPAVHTDPSEDYLLRRNPMFAAFYKWRNER